MRKWLTELMKYICYMRTSNKPFTLECETQNLPLCELELLRYTAKTSKNGIHHWHH